jgi:hypothetical protein
MQDDESRVHETVKCVYPYETGEGAICDFVRAAVKADLAEKFPSGHTGCLSTAVVEAIAADVYFDKKKEFEEDRAGAMCICRTMRETPHMRLPLQKAGRSTG